MTTHTARREGLSAAQGNRAARMGLTAVHTTDRTGLPCPALRHCRCSAHNQPPIWGDVPLATNLRLVTCGL